jgi:hypothetical protein
MIKNADIVRKFEDDFIRNAPALSLTDKFNLLDAMWQEGINLGVLPPEDQMEGLDADFRMAKALNSCLKKSLSK